MGVGFPIWASIIDYIALIVFMCWVFRRWILLRTKKKEFSDTSYPRDDNDPHLERIVTDKDL